MMKGSPRYRGENGFDAAVVVWSTVSLTFDVMYVVHTSKCQSSVVCGSKKKRKCQKTEFERGKVHFTLIFIVITDLARD